MALVSRGDKGYKVQLAVRILELRERPKLLQALRKLATVAALLALFLPALSTLAESLAAADLPPCCNSIYCPMRHRQANGAQNSEVQCGGMGTPSQSGSSVRACDNTTNPAVGTAELVLVTPIILRGPAPAGATFRSAAMFFPFVASNPSTPPPRTLPS